MKIRLAFSAFLNDIRMGVKERSFEKGE